MKAAIRELLLATTLAARPQSPHIESVGPVEERAPRWRKLDRERTARGKALPSTSRQIQCGASSKVIHDRFHRAGSKPCERAAPGVNRKAYSLLPEPAAGLAPRGHSLKIR